jgi:hypothetical protein
MRRISGGAIVGLTGLLAGIILARIRVPERSLTSVTVEHEPSWRAGVREASALDSLVDELVVLDPWGTRRSSATVEPSAIASTPEPLPSIRAEIVLQGVVGPSPWTALLTGLPGRPEPVAVAVGDTIGGWKILQIWDDSVRIRAATIARTVHLSRAWQ